MPEQDAAAATAGAELIQKMMFEYKRQRDQMEVSVIALQAQVLTLQGKVTELTDENEKLKAEADAPKPMAKKKAH